MRTDLPTTQTSNLSGAVMVVGGGIAGMQSALDLAGAGFLVYLIERDISIGGVMAQLDKTFPTNDCSTCMISPKLIEVASNPNIRVISRAKVLDVDGKPGDFTVTIRKAPRFIDEETCSGCGECIKVCPVEVPADFNEGLNRRKAIYRHFPQAIPSAFAIDKLGTSPCKDACPAGISVQGYVALIAQGRYQEALELIRRENPLPGICGRVCTHPCEDACARAEVDDPIAIRDLKRFVADWETAQGDPSPPLASTGRDEKIAIIGSGPAGLTAGYYLARAGFRPTVFEALPAAGGMLRVGIPDYRLPVRVLDYEIDYIKAAGVEILLNTPLGPNMGLKDLKDRGYAAVFLSVGAHRGLPMNLHGEGLAGVRSGVDFLREVNLNQAVCPGEKVLVIGGGNVAVDAARSALRLGAREVTILYRRTREEMPAYEEEIEEALEEGVCIEYLCAPIEFSGEDGRLTGAKIIRMELGEPDASGRRRPIPIEGSESFVPADAVLPAIGQMPVVDFLHTDDGIGVGRAQRLEADPVTLQTVVPWIFAGGDAVTGPATAIEAVAAGKTAAESIRRFIDGEDLRAGRKKEVVLARVDKTGLVKEARRRPRLADPRERIKDFSEVVCTLDEVNAKAEALRCLACGICSECYQCVEVCQAGAIKHDMVAEEHEFRVGSIVLSPGFRPFDARHKPEYGYGRWANVITSLEFERINSAAGPYGGHIQRPSDGSEPKRVAWIQCVGSRDPSIGRDYCSYVCCMYATKQAIIGQEHLPGMETTIFYMDIRAQGKGFDRYYERAKTDHDVRYIRSIPSRIIEDPRTRDLEIQYFDEDDRQVTETFDLVVLSVGLVPHPEARDLARVLDVETDRFGFAARTEVNPLITSREGVFACGVFQAPRDIPDTVMQASGAAAEAGELLAPARNTELEVTMYPKERDISGEPPRIGVFVCHCGINIGGVVRVPEVVEYVKTLPFVEHADEYLFTCSTDSQINMGQQIREHKLNRVVVASCSPRTHEPLFQDSLRLVGLNPYLFEMANIRDQCSWVHAKDHNSATEKAKDLIRMSVARASLLEPVHQSMAPVIQEALVIGGGAAGMTAALSLADQGFYTHLVEKEDRLGGLAARIHRTAEGYDVQALLADLRHKIETHENIDFYTSTRVLNIKGHVGNFTASLKGQAEEYTVNHGVVVVATGAAEYQPEEYEFGRDPRVLTQLQFHETLHQDSDPLAGIRDVVMIQCVGSRTEEHSYCSRICCTQAVANALRIKELRPEVEVTILFRDIRTFSMKELLYRQARDLGVRFIRFDPENPPSINHEADGLEILVYDTILREWIGLRADRLVLSAAVRPRTDAKDLASALKLALDTDGFFMEAHLKLRPVDFVNAGYFMCGSAHGPKFLEECISQAKAAAARAATILSRDEMPVGGEVAEVDPGKCAACLCCVRACPFGVPQIVGDAAQIDPASCQGCGVCAGVCPAKAIQVRHHTDEQVLAKTAALFDEPQQAAQYEPRIVAFICTYCTYTAADMAGSMRLQYPPNVRVVKLLCTGKVDVLHLLKAFQQGADAVMVSGCEIGDCHFLEGNLKAVKRVARAKKQLEEIGLEPERLEMFHIGASDAPKWAEAVEMMTARARELGPNPLFQKKPLAQAASA